jgi:hypothetical protein
LPLMRDRAQVSEGKQFFAGRRQSRTCSPTPADRRYARGLHHRASHVRERRPVPFAWEMKPVASLFGNSRRSWAKFPQPRRYLARCLAVLAEYLAYAGAPPVAALTARGAWVAGDARPASPAQLNGAIRLGRVVTVQARAGPFQSGWMSRCGYRPLVRWGIADAWGGLRVSGGAVPSPWRGARPW